MAALGSLKMIKKNLLLAVMLTVIWLGIDLYDLKISRLPSFKYELPIALLFVLFLFFYVNKNLWLQLNPVLHYLSVGLFSSCLTGLWFIVSVYLVLEFHLLMGGTL